MRTFSGSIEWPLLTFRPRPGVGRERSIGHWSLRGFDETSSVRPVSNRGQTMSMMSGMRLPGPTGAPSPRTDSTRSRVFAAISNNQEG